MNSLIEVQGLIQNFYDLEENASEELLAQILKYANASNQAKFKKEVQDYFPQNGNSGIGIIYEALGENPKRWGDFFVEEYKRAFLAASKAENAYEIVNSLEEICLADDTGFGDELIKLLAPYLNDSNPAIRHQSVWFLNDWMGVDNKHKYPLILKKIKDRLQDDHWKIRCLTKSILEDLEALPTGFSLSFFDRMRAKWGNIYEM